MQRDPVFCLQWRRQLQVLCALKERQPWNLDPGEARDAYHFSLVTSQLPHTGFQMGKSQLGDGVLVPLPQVCRHSSHNCLHPHMYVLSTQSQHFSYARRSTTLELKGLLGLANGTQWPIDLRAIGQQSQFNFPPATLPTHLLNVSCKAFTCLASTGRRVAMCHRII